MYKSVGALLCLPQLNFFLLVSSWRQNSCFGDHLSIKAMADTDNSSQATSVDSQVENSQDYQLDFSEDEESLVARMFNLVGQRWALIAGRIPGRTADEIEKYWTSRNTSSEQ